MSTDEFISETYEAPSTSGGYTRLQQGENRMRILSRPLLVWTIWNDGKPSRVPYNKSEKPAIPSGSNPSVKHAWILTVYNYKTEQIEVFELDKMTVINPLVAHSKDKDWGHPKNYDIVITKSGSGRENTSYSFMPKPHSEISQEVKDAFFNTPIDLEQLLVPDGNPFMQKESVKVEKKAEAPISNTGGDLPF